MSPTIKDFAVQVYWDDRAGYFVAEIPEIPTCAADGPTQAKALSNLEATFAVMKEAYLEEGLTMPNPSPQLPISVAALSAVSPLVKVSKVAELSGIPVQTLAAKVKRGTELSAGEARKIARTLSEHGVTITAGVDVVMAPHHGKTDAAKKFTTGEMKQLRRLAAQNTPTRVIGHKLGRSESVIREAASERGIALKPTNQSSYSRRSSERTRAKR